MVVGVGVGTTEVATLTGIVRAELVVVGAELVVFAGAAVVVGLATVEVATRGTRTAVVEIEADEESSGIGGAIELGGARGIGGASGFGAATTTTTTCPTVLGGAEGDDCKVAVATGLAITIVGIGAVTTAARGRWAVVAKVAKVAVVAESAESIGSFTAVCPGGTDTVDTSDNVTRGKVGPGAVWTGAV